MAKERVILHCDMNCFYASCEMAYHPELHGKPIAVCGDPERRSGIVLTASYPAKRMGVKTGMPLWEAQQHCRDIIFVPAHYDLYTRFSSYTREIFLRYTDRWQISRAIILPCLAFAAEILVYSLLKPLSYG